MNRAMEQVASLWTGWFSSCLFCPTSGDAESFHHRQSIKRRGAERDMQICHTQPHLVPPMRLVVYDDLPSPGPPPHRPSSIPSWVVEGSRNLASRASNRASMTFRRKSSAAPPPLPLRISAPSDFRRVATFSADVPGNEDDAFTPLELSFNTPKNPLPDLMHLFDSYQPEDNRPTVPGVSRPPRALSSPADMTPLRASRPRSHRPSSSVHLQRKPVGSGSRRSSLATLEQQMHLLDRQSTPIASPLIPHFSTRSSAVTGLTASILSPSSRQDTFPSAPTTAVPRTPILLDRPFLPSIPTEEEPLPVPPPPHQEHDQPQEHPPRTPLDPRPQTTATTSTSDESSLHRTPPRSGRVTQWLFQTSTKPFTGSTNSNSNSNSWTKKLPYPGFSAPPPPPLPHHFPNPFRIRSRTLSSSTVTSAQTSMTITHPFKTSSISSAATTVVAPPPPPPPMRASTSSSFTPDSSSALAKEIDVSPPMSTSTSFSRPLVPVENNGPDQPSYPTIYEGKQQKQHEYEDFAALGGGDHQYGRYRHSAVGVAF